MELEWLSPKPSGGLDLVKDYLFIAEQSLAFMLACTHAEFAFGACRTGDGQRGKGAHAGEAWIGRFIKDAECRLQKAIR